MAHGAVLLKDFLPFVVGFAAAPHGEDVIGELIFLFRFTTIIWHGSLEFVEIVQRPAYLLPVPARGPLLDKLLRMADGAVRFEQFLTFLRRRVALFRGKDRFTLDAFYYVIGQGLPLRVVPGKRRHEITYLVNPADVAGKGRIVHGRSPDDYIVIDSTDGMTGITLVSEDLTACLQKGTVPNFPGRDPFRRTQKPLLVDIVRVLAQNRVGIEELVDHVRTPRRLSGPLERPQENESTCDNEEGNGPAVKRRLYQQQDESPGDDENDRVRTIIDSLLDGGRSPLDKQARLVRQDRKIPVSRRDGCKQGKQHPLGRIPGHGEFQREVFQK